MRRASDDLVAGNMVYHVPARGTSAVPATVSTCANSAPSKTSWAYPWTPSALDEPFGFRMAFGSAGLQTSTLAPSVPRKP